MSSIIQPVYKPVLNELVLEIGDWDMSLAAAKSVAHGLTESKIRGVNVTVRADTSEIYDFASATNTTTTSTKLITIYGGNVLMYSPTGGYFDTTAFNLTPYNRGWITIYYED